jgi:hypothetical protein
MDRHPGIPEKHDRIFPQFPEAGKAPAAEV